MKLSVYLPDDIAEKSKAEGISLSPLLRDAVQAELERIEASATLVGQMGPIELGVHDEENGDYTAIFTGTLLAEAGQGSAFATDDGRVFWHSDDNQLDELEDPETDLQGSLDFDEYRGVMHQLGIIPRIAI